MKKQQKTKRAKSKRDKLLCRAGLISRVDYPSDGFRRATLVKAKTNFKRKNVDFVIFACGLISGRTVKDKRRKFKRQLREFKRQIKKREKQLKLLGKEKPKAATIRAMETLRSEIQELEPEVKLAQKQLDELDEEAMAKKLVKCIPHFTNAQGEPVDIFIITSPAPAHDGPIGEAVAHLLAAKRSDIRVYNEGSDRIHIKGSDKTIGVLVPLRGTLPSKYMSSAPEKLIEQKFRQSSNPPADIIVVAGHGVTITKPCGESERPYVTIPVLYRMSETDVREAENQVGVRVMEVYRDRIHPVVTTIPYRDEVRQERTYVGKPSRGLTKLGAKIIAVIKKDSRMPAGVIADKIKADRDKVQKELYALERHRKDPINRIWPGLVYHKDSNRWDFDSSWMREYLRYPSDTKARRVDSIVAYGCTHFGSVHTDYIGFLKIIPKTVLERNASILVGAGDFINGIKHNLVLRGETYGGLNNTQQERLAGEILAKVTMDVFKVRFKEQLKKLRPKIVAGKLTQYQLQKAIQSALLWNVIIPGNHDLWSVDFGHTPLVTMTQVMIRQIVDAIEKMLKRHNLQVFGLNQIVENKIVQPQNKRIMLPSGLEMAIRHPGMARALTTSLRPQQVLKKEAGQVLMDESGCHIVIDANFHVGEHLEKWESELGQRVCLQVGTIQKDTDFENDKLKIVDQGFAGLRVESINERIVETECSFYTTINAGHKVGLDRCKVYNDLLKAIGLR